jgi:hypothetical protein
LTEEEEEEDDDDGDDAVVCHRVVEVHEEQAEGPTRTR